MTKVLWHILKRKKETKFVWKKIVIDFLEFMRQLEENQEFGVILCNGDSFYPWCFSVDDIPSLLSHLRYDENIKIIEVQKLTADFNYFNLQMRVSVLNRRMADKKKRRACLAE